MSEKFIVPKPSSTINKKAINVSSQQIDFYPTLMEFAAKNRQQITRAEFYDTSADPGENIIYQVPEGFSFFMTCAEISLAGSATSEGYVYLTRNTYVAATSNQNIFISCMVEPNQNSTTALSFPMPLKFNSKENIIATIDNVADAFCSFFICGWLEPNPSS